MMTPQQKAALLAQKIAQEVEDAAGLGLNAARIFLVARVKETLNVPAVPRYLLGTFDGLDYYHCPTKAVAGAPPRKLSGRLQKSIESRMIDDHTAEIGTNIKGRKTKKYPKGFPYPAYHEIEKLPPFKMPGHHQFIRPTVEKHKDDLSKIIGKQVKLIALKPTGT